MSYKERFRVIVKSEYGNGREFCDVYGIDYSYYRDVVRLGKRGCVRWIEMFVIGYELGLEKKGIDLKAV